MTVPVRERTGLSALSDRLTGVAPELLGPSGTRGSARVGAGPEGAEPEGEPAEAVAQLLDALVQALAADPRTDRVWLLLVALSGTFPLEEDVRAARRQLELASPADCQVWLLEWAYGQALAAGSGRDVLRLVRGGVVVDVDHAAKHDLQTGVQRVVRRLLPRWHRDHAVELAVWTDRDAAWREPVEDERTRVLRWTGPLLRPGAPREENVLLVPWRSTVFLPEVPAAAHCARLAALAEHSGNRVAVLGHDCIPVVSADLLPVAEPTKFVRYLTVVKHADVVATNSASTAQEFGGFVSALPTQGLTGPQVVSCPLATEVDARRLQRATAAGPEPEILVVGSHEPRKNHLSVLHAAEVLWREGHRFRVRFVGGSGWSTTAFDRQLEVLHRAGRPVTAERSLDDERLWEAFQRARFSVFTSLHEGFGLPVVESLALGTPVIGTGYGSVAEIAADGGVVLVDPRDDDALTDAVRRLLEDDEELARLRGQALGRAARSWDAYAADLWDVAVARR